MRGPFGGHSACGATTPGELGKPNGSLRVAGDGASSPLVGAAENKEFCPATCADAAHGASKVAMTANTGHSRAIIGEGFITAPFSAQIAAISSH